MLTDYRTAAFPLLALLLTHQKMPLCADIINSTAEEYMQNTFTHTVSQLRKRRTGGTTKRFAHGNAMSVGMI